MKFVFFSFLNLRIYCFFFADFEAASKIGLMVPEINVTEDDNDEKAGSKEHGENALL